MNIIWPRKHQNSKNNHKALLATINIQICIKGMRLRKKAEKISKQDEKKVVIFSDPSGPFIDAPQSVKDLFEKDVRSPYISLKQFKTPFRPHLTRVNLCTKKVGPNQGIRAYHCCDCHRDSKVYCQECFNLDEHRDHDFYQDETNDNYCDCGNCCDNQCDIHQTDEVKISIPADDKKEFLSFFRSLWTVFFYLKKKGSKSQDIGEKLLEAMIGTLIQLNEGSIYYIRLTTEMLNSEVSVGSKTQKIFFELFPRHRGVYLFRKMLADRDFHYELVKSVQQFKLQKNDKSYICYSLSNLLNPLSADLKIIKSLAEQNIFVSGYFSRYINFAKNYEETSLLAKFVEHQIQEKQSNQELLNFITQGAFYQNLDIYEEQIKELMLQTGLKYFKQMSNLDDQKKLKKDKKKVARKNSKKVTSKDTENEKKVIEACKDTSSQTQRVIRMVSRLIFDFSQYDLEGLEKAITNRSDIFTNLLTILGFSVTNFSSFLDEPEIIIIILQLIQLSSFKQYLINQLWKQFFQGKLMAETFKQIYYLLSSIAYIPHLKVSLLKSRKEISAFQEQESFDWFRSLLYEGGQIEKSNIISIKSDVLEKEFGEILQELCTYNQETNCFIYTSEKQYPDDMLKFTPFITLNKFTPLLRMKVKYLEYFQIKNKLQRKILTSLFECNLFTELFQKSWKNGLKETQRNSSELSRWKGKNMGYIYVLGLICIDNIMKGTNKGISKQLQEIINDADYRFKFQFLTEDEVIHRILPFEKSIEIMKQNNIQNMENREEKKKKLYEKYKKNNLQMMNKYQSSLKQCVIETEAVCLLCKEADSKQNPLFHLGDVKVSQTPVSAFFGSQSKTQSLILTCFHILCRNCFRKKIRDHGDFNCPLCSKRTSCLLPLKNNIELEEVRQTFQNSVITSVGIKYQLFSFGGVFKLFFSSLVESAGLNSIISIHKKRQRKAQNKKVQNYVVELLKKLVENSSQSEKIKYQHIIEKLLIDVGSCSMKLVGKVQDIMINYFRMKIFSGQQRILVEKLQYLYDLLTFHQYSVIRDNLPEVKSYIDKNCPESEHLLASTSLGHRSLFVYNMKLPQRSDQLGGLCQTRVCQRCGNRRIKYYFCLFCRKVLCRHCNLSSQHGQNHMHRFLSFELSECRLHQIQNDHHRYNDVYYNRFRESFSETNDVCFLDEKKLQRIVNDFVDFYD